MRRLLVRPTVLVLLATVLTAAPSNPEARGAAWQGASGQVAVDADLVVLDGVARGSLNPVEPHGCSATSAWGWPAPRATARGPS